MTITSTLPQNRTPVPSERHHNHEALTKHLLKFHKPRKHRCYDNAFASLIWLGGAYYVEGFVTQFPTVVCGHAWIEYEGKVVDPTLPPEKHKELGYFPAVRYTPEEIVVAAQKANSILPAYRVDGAGGGFTPEVLEAFINCGVWSLKDMNTSDRKFVDMMYQTFEGILAELKAGTLEKTPELRRQLVLWNAGLHQ